MSDGESRRKVILSPHSTAEISEAHQGATSVARTLETDDVIDPADSRAWIVHGLDAAAVPAERGDGGVDAAAWRTRRDGQKRRPCVSPW